MDLVPQRYAHALLRLCDSGELDRVRRDMLHILEAVSLSPDLKILIKTKRFGRNTLRQVFNALGTSLEVSSLCQKFLSYLCLRGRIDLLESICRAFEALIGNIKEEVEVFVSSATPLEKKQSHLLQETLEKTLKKKVFLKTFLDQELLGGLTLRVGTVFVDGSLKKNLQDFQKIIKEDDEQ